MIHKLIQATSQEASQMTCSFVPASKRHRMTGSLPSGRPPGGTEVAAVSLQGARCAWFGEKEEICLLVHPSALYLQLIGEAYAKVCFIAIAFSSCCFPVLIVLSSSSHPCFFFFFGWARGSHANVKVCSLTYSLVPSLSLPYSWGSYAKKCRPRGRGGVPGTEAGSS